MVTSTSTSTSSVCVYVCDLSVVLSEGFDGSDTDGSDPVFRYNIDRP